MRRRAFIAGLSSAAAWPVVARGQQSTKIPKVGVLWTGSNETEEPEYVGALRQGLDDLGYVEGKTIELVNQFAGGQYDRFDSLAIDLIDAKVDVIVTATSFGALAVKRASSTIPIVFVLVPDPVGQHLVDSLAHPGGNMTGVSTIQTDVTATSCHW